MSKDKQKSRCEKQNQTHYDEEGAAQNAQGYASWVKNVLAPALVDLYLKTKLLPGGPERG